MVMVSSEWKQNKGGRAFLFYKAAGDSQFTAHRLSHESSYQMKRELENLQLHLNTQ